MSSSGIQKATAASLESPIVLRELSQVEKIQSAAHLLGLYCACAVSCRHAIPDALRTLGSNGPSLEDVVERAFASAILQHPLFTFGQINEDSRKSAWVRLDRIDLHHHVEWRTVAETENDEDVLRGVLEWHVNHRFTHLESRPQWRSTILRTTDLSFIEVVFAWGHTAGDGKSGKIFHETLLACLNAEASGKDTRPLKDRCFEVPDAATAPAIDQLVRFPPSWGLLLSEGWNAIKSAILASDTSSAATWAPIRLNPYTIRLTLITVEEDALQAVLGFCRQHKTTLTGLMHALTLVSLATRLSKSQARAFQAGTPICLRHLVPRSPPGYPGLDMHHTVSNCATYWTYEFDQDIVGKLRQQVSNGKGNSGPDVDLEATVWSVATTVRAGLSKKLALGKKDDTMGMLRFVGDWRSYHKERLKRPRATAWEISNLGVISGASPAAEGHPDDDEDKERWTIERAIFTQSTAAGGAVICINPLAVKGKTLTMTCSWQSEAIDGELARGLSSDLETWLNGLGKTGHIPFTSPT